MCLALVAAVVVACGGDATGPNASITGNYTLRTVNGANVPAVIYQDVDEKDELTGGNIDLSSNNSWTGNLSAKSTDLHTGATAAFNFPAHGTYTVNNGSITLTDATDNSQLVGTVGGGTLTINGDAGVGVSIVMVFKK
jgi:hypothetical protein